MNGAELPTVVQRDAVEETEGKVICTIQTNVSEEGKNPEKTEVITIKGENKVTNASGDYSNASNLAELLFEAPAETTGTGAAYIGNDTSVAEGDKEATLSAATLFAGGKGTEDSPWLISNAEEMQNISTQFDEGGYYYFKVADGVKTIDCSNWESVYLPGSFDGNNVEFINLDNTLFHCISNADFDILETATIQNFSISNCNVIDNGWKSVVIRTAAAETTYLKNISVSGYIEGSTGVAVFITFGAGNYDPEYSHISHIYFENCSSNANIVATSGNAVGFVAHAMASNGSTIVLTNSSYNGGESATSKSSCKYVVGNWYNGTIADDLTGDKPYNSGDNGWTYTLTNKQATITTAAGTLPELGSLLSITKTDGAAKCTVAFSVSPNAKPDATHSSDWGCMTSTYYSEGAESNGKWITDTIKYVTVRVNFNGQTETGWHGNYYDIVDDWAGHSIGGNTVVRFTEYDVNGNVIKVTTFNFQDYK